MSHIARRVTITSNYYIDLECTFIIDSIILKNDFVINDTMFLNIIDNHKIITSFPLLLLYRISKIKYYDDYYVIQLNKNLIANCPINKKIMIRLDNGHIEIDLIIIEIKNYVNVMTQFNTIENHDIFVPKVGFSFVTNNISGCFIETKKPLKHLRIMKLNENDNIVEYDEVMIKEMAELCYSNKWSDKHMKVLKKTNISDDVIDNVIDNFIDKNDALYIYWISFTPRNKWYEIEQIIQLNGGLGIWMSEPGKIYFLKHFS